MGKNQGRSERWGAARTPRRRSTEAWGRRPRPDDAGPTGPPRLGRPLQPSHAARRPMCLTFPRSPTSQSPSPISIAAPGGTANCSAPIPSLTRTREMVASTTPSTSSVVASCSACTPTPGRCTTPSTSTAPDLTTSRSRAATAATSSNGLPDLDELGIAHGGIVDAGYGSGVSFRDPDGIALEFFAPPASTDTASRLQISAPSGRPCGRAHRLGPGRRWGGRPPACLGAGCLRSARRSRAPEGCSEPPRACRCCSADIRRAWSRSGTGGGWSGGHGAAFSCFQYA